jgi:hypothetical protein
MKENFGIENFPQVNLLFFFDFDFYSGKYFEMSQQRDYMGALISGL